MTTTRSHNRSPCTAGSHPRFRAGLGAGLRPHRMRCLADRSVETTYRAVRLGLVILCAVAARRVDAFEVAPRDSAARALSTCLSVDDLPGDETDRLPVLERGAELAQSAIAADPSDPRARVALVCNLGKALEIAGLSWRSFQRLHRLRDAVEDGLRIAPDDPDLLTSKGQMLLRIPAALGGDQVEGERCLRRAIELRPDHPQAHRFLAEMLAERDPTAARAIAERWLAMAEPAHQAHDVMAARALLARLRP